MSSTDPIKRNRLRWFLATSAIGLIITAAVGLAVYPRWQAQQWKEALQTTPDLFETHLLTQKMLRADNPHAHAVLAELASNSENVVFAAEHRVLLMLSPETGQPYSVTRWSADNVSPNITAKFFNPRIVENIPEAVTILAANEVNGSTSLFIFTYKHNAQLCDLSSEDLKQFETNGYWNEYIARHGDRVAEKRDSWSKAEEKSWQQWKDAVKAEFGPQASPQPQ